MRGIATMPETKSVEIEKFKKSIEEQGIDFSLLESQARETEQKLPVLERSVQFATEFATSLQWRPGLRETSFHAEAKLEIDNSVQVWIDPPRPMQGTVWNTGENALVYVHIRSMFLPLRDAVLELQVDNGFTLLRLPFPGSQPDKRYFARLEPGVTQSSAFIVHAPASAQQLTANFKAPLTGEVVPYVAKNPALLTALVPPA